MEWVVSETEVIGIAELQRAINMILRNLTGKPGVLNSLGLESDMTE